MEIIIEDIEENALAQNEGRQPVHVRLHLRNGPDRRGYNEPTQREVAAHTRPK